MRRAGFFIGILALLPLGLSADETEPKPDYADFSRLIHKAVVKQLPKEFEDTSGWGRTIPAPPNLSLPRLRKYIKVGDKLEVPHGAWRRFKGKIEDPDKNLKIVVKDFKRVDAKTYRLVMDVDAMILGTVEWQQWQKGLLLIGADAVADANITAAMVCDIDVLLKVQKFPPELVIEPKVTELGLNLVDFKFRSVGPVKGDKADALSNELKEVLRSALKASEPFVKNYANQAIAQSLKEGKGGISASSIMESLPEKK